MDGEIGKLAAQWGPAFGLLLVTLYGVYRLIMWTLTQNAKRDEDHTEMMRTFLPQLQSLCDKTDAGSAILLRIEAKIDSCDTRRAHEREGKA